MRWVSDAVVLPKVLGHERVVYLKLHSLKSLLVQWWSVVGAVLSFDHGLLAWREGHPSTWIPCWTKP
jgi:hypothetical protein